MRKKIDLVFFDAGGGHRSAATALKQVAGQQGRDWEICLVNLQHVLAPLDIFRKVTGIAAEDVYNLILRKGWTFGSPQLARVMQALIRFYHPQQVKLLQKYWQESRPDLLVSVIPNFNRALFESLKLGSPGTPMVTIMTDMADYPPHFWMERQPQFFICGTDKAVSQALALGHEPSRILQTSGMILNPQFYEPIVQDRETERQRLGLHPTMPTGLVLFGGYGSKAMLEIAMRLSKSNPAVQLIMLCGHNQKLASKLRAFKSGMQIHVEGFTREIPRFMHLADFFIGKPGPGSLSEAMAMKLPVIIERNRWTMPQERYNAEWVREKGVGLVVHSFSEIESAVASLLEPEQYNACRAAAERQHNRAVFEIPDILQRILEA